MLGTMPGERSLELAEYYGHPQNVFWRIQAELFGFERSSSYEDRVTALLGSGVAVWDVLGACEREGSLDQNIRDPQPNDFTSFFREHRKIRHVFCNGQQSRKWFHSLVLPTLEELDLQLQVTGLPSTSPANAGMKYEQKLAAWRVVYDTATEKN